MCHWSVLFFCICLACTSLPFFFYFSFLLISWLPFTRLHTLNYILQMKCISIQKSMDISSSSTKEDDTKTQMENTHIKWSSFQGQSCWRNLLTINFHEFFYWITLFEIMHFSKHCFAVLKFSGLIKRVLICEFWFPNKSQNYYFIGWKYALKLLHHKSCFDAFDTFFSFTFGYVWMANWMIFWF